MLITHRDNYDHTRPSDSLWSTCPWDGLANGRRGFAFFDDFIGGLGTIALQRGTTLVFNGDAGSTFPIVAGNHLAAMTLDTTDEDAAWLTTGGNVVGAGLTPTAYKGNRWWWETRCKINTLAETGLFLGWQIGAAAVDGDTLADATAAPLATHTFIGFHALSHASAPTVDVIYQPASGTKVVANTAAHTLVAGTMVKLGQYFDGRYIRSFVDGVPLASPTEITSLTMSGFPTQTATNAWAAILKQTSGSSRILTFDWIGLAVEYVP